jgi:tRNA(fMet)-specific endonuclease VapC
VKRLLIDTNAYSALMAGDTTVRDMLAEHEVILMSPVVVGELYDGFRGGARDRENRRILARFLEKPRTACIPVTNSTAEWFAEIKRGLRKKGLPIPINDVWIAASCMEHGARLLSFDEHFSDVDGLLRC